MQILANALPGFRELRAPVIAGYMWLLFGWLLIDPNVGQRPSDRLGRAFYDLGEHIGHIGIALGVSVAAYLLGSASQALLATPRVLARRSSDEEPPSYGIVGYRVRAFLSRSRVRNPAMSAISRLAQPVLFQTRRYEALMDADKLQTFRRFRWDLEARLGAAEGEAHEELSLPATLLVGDQPGLFAEVDRLRAEGELRVAVTPPLLALLILVIDSQSAPYWAFGIPVVLVLFVDGLRKSANSRQVIANAIRKGTIKSSAALRFEEEIGQFRKELRRLYDEAVNSPGGDALPPPNPT